MRVKDSKQVSDELHKELEQSMRNPRDMFGFASYGRGWTKLDALTSGIIHYKLTLLLARPKVGKSMLAATWLPFIAEQAKAAGKVVRVVTLEDRRMSYQRRVAAIYAGIADALDIRRGKLSDEEEGSYRAALKHIGELPIEYLSNEDLDEDQEFLFGDNSGVSMSDISKFVKPDTFWWLVDHGGLVVMPGRDNTDRMFKLANELQALAHRRVGGMVISHLTRASVGGGEPAIENIGGSDQLGKNADVIMLLWRPFFESRNLSPEEQAMTAEYEPASLKVITRDEGSGRVHLVWDVKKARFGELDVPTLKLPEKK